jgi:chaperonin GroEL (HSP60 family)
LGDFFAAGYSPPSEEQGYKLENATIDCLSKEKKVTIDKDNTTTVEGAGKKNVQYVHAAPGFTEEKRCDGTTGLYENPQARQNRHEVKDTAGFS